MDEFELFEGESVQVIENTYTKDEYIEIAKSAFNKLIDLYSACWVKPDIEITEENEAQFEECHRCHGMLYYEAGGDIQECEGCVDGKIIEKVFNHEKFAEELEDLIFHDQNAIIELIHPAFKPK